MARTRIIVNRNGSFKVEGDFEIVDTSGTPFGLSGRTVISLCRCGQSENKPFCDGSHNRCGFQADNPARDLPPPAPKV
jgi:CDGSH-type Zn-finger protein